MSANSIVGRTPWQPSALNRWKQIQVKRAFIITLGKMLQNEPSSSSDEEVPYLKAQHVQWDKVTLTALPTMWASQSDITALAVGVGDLLVCEGGEVGRARVLTEKPPARTIVQNAVHIVRARKGSEPRYLAYLLRHAATNEWLDVLCNRSTIAHLTAEKFGDMWIWIPPTLDEQCAIADYLDRVTSDIDILIAKKSCFIELLREKRQALITHTVTKGLDANSPMKNSGVKWLGRVPAHWDVIPSHRLFAESITRAKDDDEMLSATQKYGVIPKAQFERLEGRRVTHAEMHLDKRKHVEIDNFVISMRSFQGGIERVKATGSVRSSYVVLVPNSKVHTGYFSYLLKSASYIFGLQSTSTFIRDGQDLNYNNFRQVELPIFSIEEQKAIASYLDRATSRIDNLIAKTERSIELLREHRTALITAAVTGKIDLHNAA